MSNKEIHPGAKFDTEMPVAHEIHELDMLDHACFRCSLTSARVDGTAYTLAILVP